MLDVKIKLMRENASLPEYKTAGAAALDLSSCADGPVTLLPGQRILIHTGIAISISSPDYVALLCARIGLASKAGVALANGVGVIDSDYRGEIFAAMINNSDTEYTVEPGERIAQLMFMPIERAEFTLTDCLDETERGAGGFGSTGK